MGPAHKEGVSEADWFLLVARRVSFYLLSLVLSALAPSLQAETLCDHSNHEDIAEIRFVAPKLDGGAENDGTGAYFELLQAVYSPLGIAVKTDIAPFNRINMLLEQQKIDASAAYYSATTAREHGLDYYLTPQSPINLERLIAIHKPRVAPWLFPDSLINKRVAWVDGYGFDKALSISYEYQRVANQLQGMKLLEIDRIDYYIDNEYDINQVIEKYHFDRTKYAAQFIMEENLYVAFAKTKKSHKLIELFDCRMKALRQSGELQAIYNKWGIPTPPEQ